MELFSEIYSCYYRVLRHLLCSQNPLTIRDIYDRICQEGFVESLLSIIPKLEDGAWNLFSRDGELYLSKLSPSFTVPLSDLEKSYLKALLSDPRIGLFLDTEELGTLRQLLKDVPPLWEQQQFRCYDRFADGDPFQSEAYRHNFRLLLHAQKKRQYVDIEYNSPRGNRVHHYYVPVRLEYSIKNDKFRLLALEQNRHRKNKLEILNIDRIENAKLTDKTLTSPVDINALIHDSYYKEPLKLRITDKRNALERAMLHFANYEKNTVKINETTYECLIYYNQSMETELLIEVMSFGPMLTVIGNERFLKSLKKRLRMQRELDLNNQKNLCGMGD